jgi:hypothetical protein
MADVATQTKRAIRRTNAHTWAAIEQVIAWDDSGLGSRVKSTKLVEEFRGPGAKSKAIDAAGTNEVV